MFRWLINGLVLVGVAYLHPGFIVENYWTALVFLFFLGLVNIFVKPVLILLTLPVTIVTLGLFLLVINTATFYWVTGWIEGIAVDSFGTAFVIALILSVSTSLMSSRRVEVHTETRSE